MMHMTQLAAAFRSAGIPPTALNGAYLTANEAAAWLPIVDAHIERMPSDVGVWARGYRDGLAAIIEMGAQ